MLPSTPHRPGIAPALALRGWSINELSELKTLHLQGTKVTENGIKDLKKTLTKVEIDN